MTETQLTHLLQYAWWLAIGAHAVLFVRLWSSGLKASYPAFFYYLAFRVVRSVVLAAVPFQRNLYAQIWFWSLPVLWFLYIVVVLELYTLVLEKYRGIASLGRWALMTGLVFALVLSSLTLGPDLSGGYASQMLRYASAIDRGIQSSLVIFLLFITGFLAWYPVPLSRNVVVHCIVYSVYFLSSAAAIFVRNVTDSVYGRQSANLILQVIGLACVGVWISMLNRRGEEVRVTRRPQWVAADSDQLIEQLAAINASLLRVARK